MMATVKNTSTATADKVTEVVDGILDLAGRRRLLAKLVALDSEEQAEVARLAKERNDALAALEQSEYVVRRRALEAAGLALETEAITRQNKRDALRAQLAAGISERMLEKQRNLLLRLQTRAAALRTADIPVFWGTNERGMKTPTDPVRTAKIMERRGRVHVELMALIGRLQQDFTTQADPSAFLSWIASEATRIDSPLEEE